MTILDEIAASTAKRVLSAKQKKSLENMVSEALALPKASTGAFETALRRNTLSFICEVKRASPSKGIISKDFPYLQIAKEYEAAGAAAISVLTEPEYFKGSNDYLRQISSEIKIPTLRKDFVIDEYQIYEAKTLGASAVLLICSLLGERLPAYIKTAAELGLCALVETHTEKEVELALKSNARIIGINNRDLKTFKVDLTTTKNLCKLIPESLCRVSESGISKPEDTAFLRECGVNAVLIGESMMLAPDKKEYLKSLSYFSSTI